MMTDWKRDLCLILALSLPFTFWGIGSISLLDPDEGMYGAIAREMAEGGDWVTPHFNGVRYLEKPPLYFWLTALTMSLFGPSEWSVRLWSALPALGTALLTWRIGCLLYGKQTGLLSAIVFLTGVGVFRYSRVAATDFLLVFSVTLAMYGFLKAVVSRNGSEEQRERFAVNDPLILCYLGIALGVLSKGAIGVVLPFLVIGLFVYITTPKGLSPVARLWQAVYSRAGIVLFFVLVLPWHLLIAWRNREFFGFYVLDNQLLRFLNSRAFIEDDVPVTTPAFLVLTLLWFFPWSLFLPAGLRHGFPKRESGGQRMQRLPLLIGLWALTAIGFFCLSGSKLEHYFLPAVPPMSLMVGALWSHPFRSRMNLHGLRRSLGVGTLGCLAVGGALLLFSDRLSGRALLAGLAELNVYYRILQNQGAAFPFASVWPFIEILEALGAVLVLGLPVASILFQLRRTKQSFTMMVFVAGAIAALVFKLMILMEPHHSSLEVARLLKSQPEADNAVVHEGSLEYSGGLPFYTGRRVFVLDGKSGDLDFGSRDENTKVLFLDRDEFSRMWESERPVYLVVRSAVQKSIAGTLPRERSFLVGEFGARSLYANQAGHEAMANAQKRQYVRIRP
ncbi:MAG: ArnT family glycosyltransferase [Candidatus Binatia bacterium]